MLSICHINDKKRLLVNQNSYFTHYLPLYLFKWILQVSHPISPSDAALSCLSGCPPPRCQWDSVMANSPERTRAAGLSDASAQTEGAINRDLSDWGEPFKDEPGPEAKWRWGGGVVNFELWATWVVFVARVKIHSCTSNPLKDDMSMQTLPRPIYTRCELVSIHLSEHVF